MSQTKTRKELAQNPHLAIEAARGPVPVSETSSPLVPVPIEVEYKGRTYSGLFDAENVSDILKRRYDFRVSLRATKMRKLLPADVDPETIKTMQDVMDLVDKVPENVLLGLLDVGEGVDMRDAKIEMYVPHLLEWDVIGINGEIADKSIEAFQCNTGGIYSVFLEKMGEVFTDSPAKPPEEEPSATGELSTTKEA